MNKFRMAKIIIVFSLLSYLSISFLRNYNSPENIEKRCILKFKKDFKNNLETSHEEWNQILDLADNNYLKCGNTSVLIMGEAKRRKNLGIPPREKNEDIKLPQLDKKAIQQKVRTTLYKYPIIPFLFYGAAILILIGGLFHVFKSFNIA